MDITKYRKDSSLVAGGEAKAQIIKDVLELLSKNGLTVALALDVLDCAKEIAIGCTPLAKEYTTSQNSV